MSTLAKDRKQSGVQFIDTAIELTNHTIYYLHRLPKSIRLVWTLKLSNLAQDVVVQATMANSIRQFKCEQDFLKRREHLQNALGTLNSLETLIGIIGRSEYRDDITRMSPSQEIKEDSEHYAFRRWGELFDSERKLLTGVLKRDEEAYNKRRGD